MARAKMRARTISVLVLVVLIVFYALGAGKAAEIRRYEEFRARQALWKEANPEVEDAIKDYIDEVDWGQFIGDFVDAFTHPALTVQDLIDYYGISDADQ